jgi:hypothetical protein
VGSDQLKGLAKQNAPNSSLTGLVTEAAPSWAGGGDEGAQPVKGTIVQHLSARRKYLF